MWVKWPRITSTELHFFFKYYTLSFSFNYCASEFPVFHDNKSPCSGLDFSLMNIHNSRAFISPCIDSFSFSNAYMPFRHEMSSDWPGSLFNEWNLMLCLFYSCFFFKLPDFSMTDKRQLILIFPSLLVWLGTLAYSNFKDEWKT